MKKRIASFDLARGAGVVFMVAGHVVFHLGDAEFGTLGVNLDIWHQIFDVWRYLTAPVYHFLMGASFGLSSKRISASQAVLQGTKLLCFGYALNALRISLPTYILLKTGRLQQHEAFDPLEHLFFTDTLQVAAVEFMILGFLQPCSQQFRVLVGLAVAVATYWLWGFTTDSFIGDRILSIIFWSGVDADLSVFPFLSYAVFGMVLGTNLKLAASEEKRRTVFEDAAKFGIVLIVASTLLRLFGPEILLEEEAYHRNGTIGVLWITGLILCWLWAWEYYWAARIPDFFARRFLFWGQNITAFYVIHWLVLGVIFHIVWVAGFQKVPPVALIVIGVTAIMVTHRLVIKWVEHKARKSLNNDVNGAKSKTM